MSILVKRVNELAHEYVRSGSKENRRLQVGRIIKFVEFIEETEHLHGLQEIGTRHVLNFWKSHRELAEKTSHEYWLSFCILWKFAGKSGTPPKPLIFPKQATKSFSANNLVSSSNDPNRLNTILSLNELATALQSKRLSKTLSIEEISRATGLDHKTISDIEDGDDSCRYIDVATLSNYFGF